MAKSYNTYLNREVLGKNDERGAVQARKTVGTAVVITDSERGNLIMPN